MNRNLIGSTFFWGWTIGSVVSLLALPLVFGDRNEFYERGWLIWIWQIVPIAIGASIWWLGHRWYAAFWLVPTSALLIASSFEIFVQPTYSTVGLLGIFVPLWCLLVIGPVSIGIGKLVRMVLLRLRQ